MEEIKIKSIKGCSLSDGKEFLHLENSDYTEVTYNKEVYNFAKVHNIPIVYINKEDNQCKINHY